MRRNRELNSWEKKDLARRMYAKRKLQQFIDWSIKSKGYLTIKFLLYYLNKFSLKIFVFYRIILAFFLFTVIYF